MVREFVGDDPDDSIDTQPVTTSVETVTFEAREGESFGAGEVITVDAKNMSEIDSIGSLYSDGDLLIENLTTLANDQIRLTSDMTVTMAYTDNFNTDADASDLTVYFDEDYLNNSVSNSGSQLEIKLVNAVTNVIGGNPLFGTDGFTFSFDGTEIGVDISAIAADDTLDFSTAYQAVADLINEQLAVDYPTLTATLGAQRDAAFSIDLETEDATYAPGDEAGVYFPILITNSGPEALTEGSFDQAQVEADTNIAANQDDTPPAESTNAISINVDLEKVGRDGEGGNLIIGGKNSDATGDTDVDQNDGIEVFNINVIGDVDKPSNLGQIAGTNGALDTVNIATDSGENAEDGYAALTVRGEAADGTVANPFGGTLDVLNANAFLGDLAIGALTGGLPVVGADSATLIDVTTFTATGGGDVSLAAGVGVNGALAETQLASARANEYTITTAGGEDTIGVMARGGAQLTVTTGAGDDTISVDVDGTDNSGSDDTAATVVALAGDNTVTATAANDTLLANRVTVVTGGGSDTVLGTNAGLTALTGAGNDVIFAENTGTAATATLADGAYDTVIAAGTTAGLRLSNFLNGREVSITVAMPEETTALTAEAVDFVNGYELETFVFESAAELSTEVEFYNAVAGAINSDATINNLVTASVDSNGNLSVAYAIDGSTVAGEQLVEINISDEYAAAADIPDALLATVQGALSNSAITAADVLTAYDATTTAFTDNYAVTSGVANVMTFNVSTLTTDALDVITFEVNGVTGTVTEAGADGAGTFDDAGASPEADLAGSSVLIGDALYNITTAAANFVTLTQVSGTPDVLAALTDASVTDDQAAPNSADASTSTGELGSNGTDSTTVNVNFVNGEAGDDIIVLSSLANVTVSGVVLRDTIAFDAGGFGNDTVVHFETGANGDVLDFTDWLDGETSASGSTASEVDIDVTLVTNLTNIVANSVVVEDFDQVQTAFGTGAITFAEVSDSQLLQALNGTAAGGNASIFANDSTSDIVGDSGKAIMLIQNDDDGDGAVDAGDNFGEYLVVEVTFADAGDGAANNDDNFTAATIVGTIDFGEVQAFNVANFGG